MSQAFNSHVITGKNPWINHAIHVLLMHTLCTLYIRILGSAKIDVINSNMYRNERRFSDVRMKSLVWNRLFQNLRICHACMHHYSSTKMNFSKRFSKVFK